MIYIYLVILTFFILNDWRLLYVLSYFQLIEPVWVHESLQRCYQCLFPESWRTTSSFIRDHRKCKTSLTRKMQQKFIRVNYTLPFWRSCNSCNHRWNFNLCSFGVNCLGSCCQAHKRQYCYKSHCVCFFLCQPKWIQDLGLQWQLAWYFSYKFI